MATDAVESPPQATEEPPKVSRKSLKHDVLLMLISKGSMLTMSMAGGVIVARTLGLSGRGALAVAVTLTLTLVQIGSAGMSNAAPYFISKDPRETGSVIVMMLWATAIFGVVLVGLGALVSALIPSLVQGLDSVDLAIVLAGVPAALGILLLAGILLGEGRTLALNVVETLDSVIVLAGIAIGLLVFDIGVRGVLVILTTAHWATVIACALVALRGRPSLGRPSTELVRGMLSFGGRIYLATLLGFLVIRLDLLLVNAYGGPDQAGLYSVVAAIADMAFILPMAVGMNLFPRIAGGEQHDTTASVFRSFALLYGAFCLITIPLARPAIELLYGPSFGPAANLYYWIVPGIFCFGMLGVLSNHFAGRGYPWEAALVWVPGLALNVTLNVLLLPRYGTVIASISSSVAYALLLVLHIRMFARHHGSYAVLRPRPRETLDMLRSLFPTRIAAPS